MASGVNVKMGVSGVAQFKQNMNQAKQAVKTLDAQLALSEKQFKQTGDSESYMAEKSALLDAKLENQKKLLENTEKALEEMTKNGVDRSSKAYQDMYRQMVQAKSEIIDTENAMNGMTDAGDKASDSVSELNSQMASIGKGVAWDNVTNGLKDITSGMENVIKKSWQVGKSIVDATLGAGAWADELQTTADKYEIPPEKLYKMRQVADFIDTDAETILDAQDKLAKNNAKQSEDFMGALAHLDINPTGKSTEDLFWEAGEAIASLTDDEAKAEYATRVFGKSWRELMPLFKAGREEYDKAFGETSWIGDENFKSLTALDDASQKLNNSWETLQQTFLGTLAGPMKDVFELLNGVLEEFNKYLQSDEGKEALKQMGETIKTLIEDLVNINPADVANGLKTVVEDITKAFEWIKEHKGDVVTALEVIAGGFALLKLGEVATNIGKIVNGFTTLWNGANKKLPTMPGTPTGSPTGTGTGTGTETGGNGGLKTWLTGAGASIKSFFSMNGLSVLTPAAVVALAIAPALAANQATFEKEEAERTRRLEASKKLDSGNSWFLEQSANALGYQRNAAGELDKSFIGGVNLGNMDQIYALLMGMNSRSDLEKSQLHNLLNGRYTSSGYSTWEELQRLWRGEEMDPVRVTAALESVTEAYEQMADQADDVTGATEKQTESNKELTDAAEEMKKLPDLAAAAVSEALNNTKVVINGEELTAVVGTVMAGLLARYQTQ